MIDIGIIAAALVIEGVMAFVWLNRKRRGVYEGQRNRWPEGGAR